MSKMMDLFSALEMCKVLGVRRSYYRWIKQEKKREEKKIAKIPLTNKADGNECAKSNVYSVDVVALVDMDIFSIFLCDAYKVII